jgi:hypothetical protein
MSRPDDGSRLRCQARIWPGSWSGWGQCPGRVRPDGNCSAYGSQHRADPRPAAPAAEADEVDCGHHSWAGLMALLDEHWPADLFPTREDDPGRDAGARIVSLLRWVDRLQPTGEDVTCP